VDCGNRPARRPRLGQERVPADRRCRAGVFSFNSATIVTVDKDKPMSASLIEIAVTVPAKGDLPTGHLQVAGR